MTKEQAIKNLEGYLGYEWDDGYLNELYTEAKAENDEKLLQLLDDYVKVLGLEESLEDEDPLRWLSPEYKDFIEWAYNNKDGEAKEWF